MVIVGEAGHPVPLPLLTCAGAAWLSGTTEGGAAHLPHARKDQRCGADHQSAARLASRLGTAVTAPRSFACSAPSAKATSGAGRLRQLAARADVIVVIGGPELCQHRAGAAGASMACPRTSRDADRLLLNATTLV